MSLSMPDALSFGGAAGPPAASCVSLQRIRYEAAGQLNARFLVVGGKGRSGIARLILGDTTRSILQRSPCPVIVVPMSAEFAEG